jgi:hypothetical protein
MIREKEKNRPIFKTNLYNNTGENSKLNNTDYSNKKTNNIGSLFDQINMNIPLGKNLTFGRRINNAPKHFLEKNMKLELISKQSISSNQETNANNSPDSSDKESEINKKKSPTHHLIPYCKRNDEQFKQTIIKKLKEKPKKKIYFDDKFANTKYKPPDVLSKRIKINSTKKMFIEDIRFEFPDNFTNKIKYKKFILYKENEVGFTDDWQEFIIEMSNDEDLESEDDVVEKGVEASLRELEDGFVEFHKNKIKRRNSSRSKK